MTVRRFLARLALLAAAVAMGIEAIADGASRFRPGAGSARKRERDASPDRPFPRAVADDRGYTMTIAGPPRRIASHELTADEVLFDLAGESRIVAVSRNAFDARDSNGAARVKRLGLPCRDDPEAVLRLEPDLVLAGVRARAEWAGLLRCSGAPVYCIENSPAPLAGLGDLALRIGYLAGAGETAAEIVAAVRRRLDQVRKRRLPRVGKPRILGFSRSMSYSYGVQMLLHDIATLLGGVNAGAGRGLEAYGGISSGRIAVWNPEWIATGPDLGQSEKLRQNLLSDPAAAMTTAARAGRILILPNNVFLTASRHGIEFVEGMAGALYPEAA